jgi:outer membrane lipoprotein-sorting protein
MSSLGELLVVLHGEVPRFGTVRVTVGSWSHRERALEAFERGSTGAVVSLYVGGESSEPPPVEETGTLRVWYGRPDRWRIERDRATDYESSLEIHVGDTWWRYSEAEGSVSNAGDSEPIHSSVDSSIATMLEPWSAVGALAFERTEATRFVGREALSVSARPRPGSDDCDLDWLLMGLSTGADEYRLIVDRERGVLLRVEALLDGAPFAVEEVREIAFDETLPDELFSFADPGGRPIRSASEQDTPEHGPLHELAAKTPFTALAPAELDPGWELRASLLRPDPPSPAGAQLHLHYYGRHGYSFGITQSAVDEPAQGYDPSDPNWRTIQRRGLSLDVLELKGGMHELAIVRFQREGTHIEMQTQQLPLDRLLEVAVDLQPAPTDPPPTVSP